MAAARPPVVEFRQARAEDVQSIRELQDALLQVKYGVRFYTTLLRPCNSVYVAAEVPSQRVVGVATARDAEDGHDFFAECASWVWGSRMGYIMTFGVHSGFRRRGIGDRLLQLLMADLKSRCRCTHVSLHCLSTNWAAIAMYRKRGFFVNTHLPAHYHFDNAHHDAFEMVAQLQPAQPMWLLRCVSAAKRSVVWVGSSAVAWCLRRFRVSHTRQVCGWCCVVWCHCCCCWCLLLLLVLVFVVEFGCGRCPQHRQTGKAGKFKIPKAGLAVGHVARVVLQYFSVKNSSKMNVRVVWGARRAYLPTDTTTRQTPPFTYTRRHGSTATRQHA